MSGSDVNFCRFLISSVKKKMSLAKSNSASFGYYFHSIPSTSMLTVFSRIGSTASKNRKGHRIRPRLMPIKLSKKFASVEESNTDLNEVPLKILAKHWRLLLYKVILRGGTLWTLSNAFRQSINIYVQCLADSSLALHKAQHLQLPSADFAKNSTGHWPQGDAGPVIAVG